MSLLGRYFSKLPAATHQNLIILLILPVDYLDGHKGTRRDKEEGEGKEVEDNYTFFPMSSLCVMLSQFEATKGSNPFDVAILSKKAFLC